MDLPNPMGEFCRGSRGCVKGVEALNIHTAPSYSSQSMLGSCSKSEDAAERWWHPRLHVCLHCRWNRLGPTCCRQLRIAENLRL